MNILITGGAGYTGILLAEALLSRGHEVTVLDNFMFGFDSVLHLVPEAGFSVVKTDIRNEDSSYLEDMEVVFHLAAISGYPACEANPNSSWTINVRATERIVAALAPEQVLVYPSTTSFYGSTGDVGREDGEVAPVSLYGLTKYEAEQIVMQRENSIALRWATVFGVSPRMRAGLLINDFVDRAIQDRAIVIYDGESTRSFIHVRDLVRGYLFSLDHVEQMRGGIYNMGDGDLNYSKNQIAEAVARAHPCDIVQSRIGDKDIRDFKVSYEKIRRLGFTSEVSIDVGIAELVKLYRFYTPHSFVRPI